MDEKPNEHAIQALRGRVTRRQILRGLALGSAGALAARAWPVEGRGLEPAPERPAARPLRQTPGGKVTWAMTQDPTCLAPFGVLPGAAHEGKELMYDSLVAWDRNLNVIPALAESWEMTGDRTMLFKLRQGVRFHDGKELDADDVKYSVEIQGNAPGRAPIPQYPKIDSVDAVDKYTARLNMKEPDPTVLGWFAWTRWSSITSKGFLESGNSCTSANGTGPFKLVEYVANDRVVMTRHGDFWRPGLPYLDEVTLKILPDESARVAALRSGAIDGADVSADAVRTLNRDSNIQILKGLTSSPRVLQFTVKGDGKPWNDKRVRQAMSMAIDRQDLIDRVYGGDAEFTGPIPPGYGSWPLSDDALRNRFFRYDPDAAKRLLSDAGYGSGFSITIHTVPTADYAQSAEVVKDQLKRIGVDVNIVLEEIGIFAKRYNEGDFEWLLNGRGMRHDPIGYLNEFGQVDQGQAKTWFDSGRGWHNDEITQLYQQLATTLDPSQRLAQAQRLQELALDEAVHVFLAQPYKYTAVRRRIQDMYVSFTDFRPGLREVWING